MAVQLLRNVQECYTEAADHSFTILCHRKCHPRRLRVLFQDSVFTMIKYFIVLFIWAWIIHRSENPSEVAYLENFTSIVNMSNVPYTKMRGFALSHEDQVYQVIVNGSAPVQLGPGILARFQQSVLNISAVAQMTGISLENLTRAEAERKVGGNWVCTEMQGGASGHFFQPIYPEVHFTWPGGSVFFAMTVFTTIGYGSYAPETRHGKLLMIPMALFGFAVTAAVVSSFLNLCQYMTDRIVAIHPRVCGRFGKVICTSIAMGLMLSLLVEGLRQYEGWEDWESRYFAWITMTTIGFGDLCPTTRGGQALTMFMAIIFVALFPFWIQTCYQAGIELCLNLRTKSTQVPTFEVSLKVPVTEFTYHGQEGWISCTTQNGEQFRVLESWIVHAPDELIVAMDQTVGTKAEKLIAPGYRDNRQPYFSELAVNKQSS